MEIPDCSKEFNIPRTNLAKHSILFPKNIFCVISGSTGSGKTNLLLYLLKKEKILNYSDVYVYCSKLYQPAYEHLKVYYEKLEKLIQNKTNKLVKIAHFFGTDEKIIDPSELDKNTNHIMIFDDVMLKDQTVIKEYFCTGRHNNVNVFYLCQSLYKIAKHCIRDNANIFILFHQDKKMLRHFHDTHVSGDMDFKEFKQFCDEAWNKKFGFVVINIWDEPYCGRYWSNYNKIYIPDKFIK
jgi:hypothetical protein